MSQSPNLSRHLVHRSFSEGGSLWRRRKTGACFRLYVDGALSYAGRSQSPKNGACFRLVKKQNRVTSHSGLNPLKTGHVSDQTLARNIFQWYSLNPLKTGHVSDLNSQMHGDRDNCLNPLKTGHVSDFIQQWRLLLPTRVSIP